MKKIILGLAAVLVMMPFAHAMAPGGKVQRYRKQSALNTTTSAGHQEEATKEQVFQKQNDKNEEIKLSDDQIKQTSALLPDAEPTEQEPKTDWRNALDNSKSRLEDWHEKEFRNYKFFDNAANGILNALVDISASNYTNNPVGFINDKAQEIRTVVHALYQQKNAALQEINEITEGLSQSFIQEQYKIKHNKNIDKNRFQMLPGQLNQKASMPSDEKTTTLVMKKQQR